MRTLGLALRPIRPTALTTTTTKKNTMMKSWNYGPNSKLISKHMIMINELMTMITIMMITIWRK